MKKALFIIDAQNHFVNEHTENIPSRIAHFIESRRFELVLFFQFVNDTNVFSKTSFSALQSQEVVNYLEANKVKSLFICGFDTDGCVLATAMDAFDKGYKVRVLQDLCGSHHGSDYHKNTIEILKRNMRSVPIKSSDI